MPALRLIAGSSTTNNARERFCDMSSQVDKGPQEFKPVRPAEMRLITGFIFMAFIITSICLLGAFYTRIAQINGKA